MAEQQAPQWDGQQDDPTWRTGDSAPAASRATGNSFLELLETALFIVLVFFIVRGLVQNFRIEGSSMQSTLEDKQYILVNKVVYFHFDAHAPLRLLPGHHDLPPRMVYPFRKPQRGDIVVLEAPAGDYDVQRDYIKRVIAMPGESVQVKDGKVFVNGTELDEPYLNQPTDCGGGSGSNPGLCEPYVVPPDTVVVMGDNRSDSQDSRSWSAPPALPLDRVVGKAWLSYWPRNEWGVIPSPVYAIDGQQP